MTIRISTAVFMFLAFAIPLFAAAQESELRATVRAALLSDPRTSTMSQSQIDAMVNILAQEAESQGVTAEDIRWRPTPETFTQPEETGTASCGNVPGFLCRLNQAFGFSGSDTRIPILLGVGSALLIFVIGALLELHHLHHKRAAENAMSSQQTNGVA